ncbi:MAG: galactosyltransferase-related protein [Rhodanobacteraceae bacterium]
MNPISYILTYREGDEPSRRDNLLAVLTWLAQYPMFVPIVVEQDDAPRLSAPLPSPNCKHIFAYNPGPFNKSWGFNIGFRASDSPWIAFADADVILGSSLPATTEYLREGFQAIKPYRTLIDLDPQETRRVAAGEFDWLPPRDAGHARNREGGGEYIVFAGGVFLIARAAFVHVGGWDERFRGWGGEDDAMSYKLERARLPAIELDQRPAVHLYHPRTPQTMSAQPHYAANLSLLEDYRRLEDPELRRFAEVQMQSIGYREKYRPT